MNRRIVPLALSLSIVSLAALSAAVAWGQASPSPATLGQPGAPVSQAEFKQAIEELKAEIQSLRSPTPTPPDAAPSPSNAGHEGELSRRVAELEKQVADLQQSHKELVNIANDQSVKLREIAMERTGADGEKHYVPNVQAIRDDRDSRKELVDTVVQGFVKSTGELKIHNEMGVGQTLVVNGVLTVFVPANAVQAVNVPAGTATTELAGEGVKSWAVGAPNYSQDIVIAPARRSAWQDPATGVVYQGAP